VFDFHQACLRVEAETKARRAETGDCSLALAYAMARCDRWYNNMLRAPIEAARRKKEAEDKVQEALWASILGHWETGTIT